MFSKTSMTGTGLLVYALAILFEFLGLDIDEGSITEAVNAFVIVVSFTFVVWGQLRRKDLELGLFRK